MTSTHQTFEIAVGPNTQSTPLTLVAAVSAVADSTVQYANDIEYSVSINFGMDINTKLLDWAGGLLNSGFRSAIRSKIDDPYNAVQDEITDMILTLDQNSEAQLIASLIDLRDVGLEALKDQMVNEVVDLVFGTFQHGGQVKLVDGGNAYNALTSAYGLDVTGGAKQFDIDPIVKFGLSDPLKQQLIQGNFQELLTILDDPFQVFSEVGIGVSFHFGSESFAKAKMTVRNLTTDLSDCTFVGSLDFMNVQAGAYQVLTFGLSSEYDTATDLTTGLLGLEAHY